MPKNTAKTDSKTRRDFTYKYLTLGIENNKAYPIKMHELIKPTAAITFKRSIVLTSEGRPNEYSEPKNSIAFGFDRCISRPLKYAD